MLSLYVIFTSLARTLRMIPDCVCPEDIFFIDESRKPHFQVVEILHLAGLAFLTTTSSIVTSETKKIFKKSSKLIDYLNE